MKGKIVIESSGNGYAIDIDVSDVSVLDKFELMHAMSTALDMDEQDMHMYILAETLGVMRNSENVTKCMNSDQLKSMLRGEQPEGVTINMTELRRQMNES